MEEQGKEEKDTGVYRQEEDKEYQYEEQHSQSEEHPGGGPQNEGEHVPNEFEDLIEEVNQRPSDATCHGSAPGPARGPSRIFSVRPPLTRPPAASEGRGLARPAFLIRYRASVLGEDVVDLRISTRLDKPEWTVPESEFLFLLRLERRHPGERIMSTLSVISDALAAASGLDPALCYVAVPLTTAAAAIVMALQPSML